MLSIKVAITAYHYVIIKGSYLNSAKHLELTG
jgi:hypothetical protein